MPISSPQELKPNIFFPPSSSPPHLINIKSYQVHILKVSWIKSYFIHFHGVSSSVRLSFCFCFLPKDSKFTNLLFCYQSCPLPAFMYTVAVCNLSKLSIWPWHYDLWSQVSVPHMWLSRAAPTFLPSLCLIILMFALSVPTTLKSFQSFKNAILFLPSRCFFMLTPLLRILLPFVWPTRRFSSILISIHPGGLL